MINDARFDKLLIKRSFAAAAGRYDSLASLQRRVGGDLLQKFPPQATPGTILDVGCGTGFLTRQLLEGNAAASVLALDIALPMLNVARQQNACLPAAYLCADAESLPLANACVQQIYSNLALQWCQDLQAVFTDCRRILRTDGQWVFATFGPTTLFELKAAWARVDDYVHVNPFYSAADIKQFLTAAGWLEFEIESINYQINYPSVMALMQELKGIGAHNVNQARNRKPTTRQQLRQMITHYEQDFPGVEVPANYEIIFVRARM